MAEADTAPLHVLLVEDDPRDAEVVCWELRRGGLVIEAQRVDTAAQLCAVLDRWRCDLVLCDWHLPSFDVPSTLAILRERGLDVPIIIVSGEIGEEAAVEAMRAGVHDYFLKGKLFPRLIPAIRRELREARTRAELRRRDELLLIADRMAAVGMIVAGVMHEVNNPLTAVLGSIEVAQHRLASGDGAGVQRALADAAEGARRVRNIVRDMRLFASAGVDEGEPADPAAVLDSTVRLVWNELQHRAQLTRDYADAPRVVLGDSRLGQVLLNLLVNAIQAIPDGAPDRHEIRLGIRPDAGGVAIEVIDTGSGIAPDLLSRLFTPFTSTKSKQVGTGLGLWISHRLVSEAGGTLSATSELGRGTTFRVWLPAAAPALPPSAPVAAPRPSRTGRILIVDDDAIVVATLRRMLGDEHEVATADNAEAAHAALDAGARYDLILCDVMMPGATGPELHGQLAERYPEQAERMVFMTGGALTQHTRTFLRNMETRTLEKPFSVQEVFVVVARYVGSPVP